MVLQLAHHVQSFLHQYNVPNLSFFDQMLANQLKQEEKMIQEMNKEREAKVAEDREHDQDVVCSFRFSVIIFHTFQESAYKTKL